MKRNEVKSKLSSEKNEFLRNFMKKYIANIQIHICFSPIKMLKNVRGIIFFTIFAPIFTVIKYK
jgi:hypothetical protein